MAVKMRPGNLPHVAWIDLKSNGVYTECAVMKQDGLGNVYFIKLTGLDQIDRKRLARILTNRNATHFELWDLMSNVTLHNGCNALDYFHQLVEVITASGQIMKPREGVLGAPGTDGVIDTRSDKERAFEDERASRAAKAAASAAAQAAADAFKRM